ncbi:MAG: hypothetical protein CMJ25_02320 [Phycisphaerae bacterium]|nr:hypothetical protein [Phycisphaerae bacterium]
MQVILENQKQKVKNFMLYMIIVGLILVLMDIVILLNIKMLEDNELGGQDIVKLKINLVVV